MQFTEATEILEQARVRRSQALRWRLFGIPLCTIAFGVIVSGPLGFDLWTLGDPHPEAIVVYLSFPLLYVGWVLTEGRKIPVVICVALASLTQTAFSQTR